MNKTYRYTLEPYKGPSTRYTCPSCGKKKTFTRYIDTQTGQHLQPQYGRCDREVNCGYHTKPEFKVGNSNAKTPNSKKGNWHKPRFQTPSSKAENSSVQVSSSKVGTPIPVGFSTIPKEVVAATLCDYENNYLAQLLGVALGKTLTMQLLQRYCVGTHHHWLGSTVFWQIDEQQRIRTGKLMLYSEGGRRVKEPFNHVSWMHTVLELKDYRLNQCLFGQHLLRGNTKKVYLVESEKTALLGAAYLPQFLWLATGGLSNLCAEKLQPLSGHDLTLMPDLGAADKWQQVAGKYGCKLSTRLAEFALETEKQQGLDIGDYFLWAIRKYTG